MNSEPEKPDSAIGDADYNEKHDISNLHSAALREKGDPDDGNEPISLWMVTLMGITLFCGGLYLAMYSGGFRADEYNIYSGGAPGGGAGAAKAEAGEKKELTLAEVGEKVYRQNCVACHQATGAGMAGAFPPLVGADWVTGSEQRVVGILLHGLVGPVDVNGTTYNGVMQPWATTLTDKKIAGVVTYIRTAWGNSASEISPEQVATARVLFKDRKESWTAEELLKIPADAALEGSGAEAAPATAEPTEAPVEAVEPEVGVPAAA